MRIWSSGHISAGLSYRLYLSGLTLIRVLGECPCVTNVLLLSSLLKQYLEIDSVLMALRGKELHYSPPWQTSEPVYSRGISSLEVLGESRPIVFPVA